MSRRKNTSFKNMIWSTLALGTTSMAYPYNYRNDVYQDNVQQNLDSMTPVEKFIYNQAVVHTFDTIESCSRKCPRQCVVQEVADLMMPRYVCSKKGTLGSELTPLTSIRDYRALNEDILPFSSQYLLIVVPIGMLILVIVFILWCRKCSSNSNSSMD